MDTSTRNTYTKIEIFETLLKSNKDDLTYDEFLLLINNLEPDLKNNIETDVKNILESKKYNIYGIKLIELLHTTIIDNITKWVKNKK